MTESKFVKAYIDRAGGTPIGPIDLPTSLKYVPLPRYIDFIVECRKFDHADNPILVMASAISGFTDWPLIEIVEGQVGNVFAVENAGISQSITGLFTYISNLCFRAKGELVDRENATFEVDGIEYIIPYPTQQAIAGEIELPYLSVIQTIEAVEFQRLKEREVQAKGDPTGFIKTQIMQVADAQTAGLNELDPARMYIMQAAKQVTAREVEKAGDPNGTQMFTLYLRMAALLSRRVDDMEPMPFDDAEREVWINNRVVALQKMDTQTALNIGFFLTTILSGLESIPETTGSLIRPLLNLWAATRLRKVQPGRKRRPTAKKSSGG